MSDKVKQEQKVIYQWEPEFQSLPWHSIFKCPVSKQCWVFISFQGEVSRDALQRTIKMLEMYLDEYPEAEPK